MTTQPYTTSLLFFVLLLKGLFFSPDSHCLDFISNASDSSENSSEELKKKIRVINHKINLDLQELSQFAENIKQCKRATLTITSPQALQSVVQNYLNAGKLTEEETDEIFHQYDLTYDILGMKGKNCHYTIKINTEPDKLWNCSVSAKELASFSNFLQDVSEKKSSMKNPIDPFPSHHCHLKKQNINRK